MPRAVNGSTELEYTDTGGSDTPGSGEPLLLIGGLGGQLTDWPDGWVTGLTDRGLRVLTFDNRDSGLSTQFDSAGPADIVGAMQGLQLGQLPDSPYLLSDMAADAAAVLDAAGLASAHVLGVSMGGMIAQTLAIEHPERVRSLISIMSTTGDRSVGGATPQAAALLVTPRSTDRTQYLEQAVKSEALLAGPHYPGDPDAVRARAAVGWDRNSSGAGVGRQLVAIRASGDRTAALAGVRIPTLVIHGDADPLIVPSGGEATAAAIPGARLVIVPGMGHALRPGVWAEIIALVADQIAAVAAQ